MGQGRGERGGVGESGTGEGRAGQGSGERGSVGCHRLSSIPIFSTIPINSYFLRNSYFLLFCGFLDSPHAFLPRILKFLFAPHMFFVVNLHFVLHSI